MPDPIFAAEMAALAAEHRARERNRIGDGMAALGADPKNPNAWMDFSGPRVPVPSTNEPKVDPRLFRSEFHQHNGTSECLTASEQRVGWVRCSRNNVEYHVHGDRLMAHAHLAACSA